MDSVVSGPPRLSTEKKVAIGVGAAVALGLAFGLMAKPDFDAGKSRGKRARPAAAAAPASDGQVQIMVTARAAPAIPTSRGKLETMSGPPLVEDLPDQSDRPATVRVARDDSRKNPPDDRNWFERLFGQPRAVIAPQRARPERPPVPAQPAPVYGPEQNVVDDESGFEMVEPSATRMETRRAAIPARSFSPSFDCRYARSRAEQLVCADPDLAAADRRLARAYAEAVRGGYPRDELRQDQDRWLRAREQAARYDADAVAEVYEERTAELEDLGNW